MTFYAEIDHGTYTSYRSFTGMDKETVKELLKDSKLKYKLIEKEEYDVKVAPFIDDL